MHVVSAPGNRGVVVDYCDKGMLRIAINGMRDGEAVGKSRRGNLLS